VADGSRDLYRRSNTKVRDILATHQPQPDMAAGLNEEIEQLLLKL